MSDTPEQTDEPMDLVDALAHVRGRERDALAAENERLTRQLDEQVEVAALARAARFRCDEELTAAVAANERLTRERDECERQLQGWIEQVVAAEAANERLRAALTQIENLHGGYPDDYCSIARAALREQAVTVCPDCGTPLGTSRVSCSNPQCGWSPRDPLPRTDDHPGYDGDK